MSERPLPDDLTHWPEDPHDLLGVSYQVTPRDLRRAYNRLIRIYKPEQFPEQFRRIREAYESLLRIAELFAPRADTPPPSDGPRSSTASDGKASFEEEGERSAGSSRPAEEEAVPARRPQEELDELWESAIAGHAAGAYQRLMELTRQHAGRTELYSRLYWLLTLFPKVDARRVPADWLVQGLLATGLAGSLQQLYREELADNPPEALSERYERLLEAPISSSLLADLIEWRFQAAVRLRLWKKLAEDLSRLCQRFGPGEERLWLRLLFSLAEGVSVDGADDPEGVHLLSALRTEIVRHKHLALSMSHSFDRFDLLLEALAGWLEVRYRSRVPATMLRLVGGSWSRPFAEIRQSLMEVLESMTGAPQKWLDYLDEMHKRSPATLALFGELLDQFEESRSSETERRDRNALARLVLPLLSRLSVTEYEGQRTRLLLFCIREAVSPEDIAEVADAWARTLLSDWPLRYVCRACRLFWL